MPYRHTQTGWFLLYAIGITAGVLALVSVMARDAEGPVGLILAATFVVLLIPRGTLWNVNGMRAVELELASNRRFAIGSDEPEALQAAIEDARRAAIG